MEETLSCFPLCTVAGWLSAGRIITKWLRDGTEGFSTIKTRQYMFSECYGLLSLPVIPSLVKGLQGSQQRRLCLLDSLQNWPKK